MKVLWHSNAPWVPSGYGQQTRLFVPLIKQHGVDVAISAMYGHGGSMGAWGDNIPVYPGGYDAYGNDVLTAYASDWFGREDQGWIVTLFDVYVFTSETLSQFHNAAWVPVDHDPVPPIVTAALKKWDMLPLAMSRFGQRTLADFDLEALYVPHGFDPLMEPKDKEQARGALGLPSDGFIVGMNAANKATEIHRKNFDGAFQAFAEFSKTHPDARLFVHSEAMGASGHNLDNFAHYLEIEDKVIFSDQFRYRVGVPHQAMPWLYSAFDVLLSPSMGEGFGIPIIEAQACGVPVIVTDHTAMPELVFSGRAVAGELFWHEAAESMWKKAYVGEIIDALNDAYDGKFKDPHYFPGVQAFRADRVFEKYWVPALENMAERLAA